MAIFSTIKRAVDRRYEAQAAANCNTCHVGAWVVSHESHLLEKSGGNSMMGFFKRFGGNRTQAVPTCDTAKDTTCYSSTQECKILIVCKGTSFSRGVADYAVDMAKKTRTSLVALSLDESGRDFDSFKNEAARGVEYFSCKAADAGLGFYHEVRQGDEDTVVAQMHESDPQFRYVMDDSAAVCKNRSSIPVYTRATLRAK